jgi:TusA-related sulfurtransferase
MPEEIIKLDITKKACPLTLLITLDAVNKNKEKLRKGKAKIVVILDHKLATSTIPQAVAKMGYIAELKKLGSLYEITIRGGKNVP